MKIKAAFTLSILLTSCLVNGQYIAKNNGSIVTSNLTAVTSFLDIVTFYQYNVPDTVSYNGPAYLAPDLSINSFLFKDTTSGALSFVTIFGRDQSGATNWADSTVTLTGASASFSVRDDNPGNDTYYNSGPAFFSVHQAWLDANTDGYAITDISGFTHLLQSMDSSLSTWYLHSGNAEGDPFQLSFDTLEISVVPEPSTVGLMVIAGIPLALILRRRLLKK